jgi:hypothetical protein
MNLPDHSTGVREGAHGVDDDKAEVVHRSMSYLNGVPLGSGTFRATTTAGCR